MEFTKEDWITHRQLDVPISKMFQGTENTETPREFIDRSEKCFGMDQSNPDEMSYESLNEHIEFLDYLWMK